MSKYKIKKPKDIYICDPEKKKGICESAGDEKWCGKECFCTTHIEYAKEPIQKLTGKQWEKEMKRRSE